MATQQADRVMREHAVAAAAVGEDVAVRWQLGKPLGELLEGDVDGTGEVPRDVLGRRPHVEDDSLVPFESEQKFVGVDGGGVFRPQIGATGQFGVRAVSLCDPPQGVS